MGADPAESTLKLEAFIHAARGKVLVDDISIHVPQARSLPLSAQAAPANGCLRLINRLDEPTDGTVLLGGQDYRGIAPQQLRRRVGMVMQTAYLFPGSVAGNIAFGPHQRGERLSANGLAALLERVGLPGYQDREVGKLSGGEAQRVSVARMLANEPEVLLLDEPTSALDETSARGIEKLIMSIVHERRMTCVIVTHNASGRQSASPGAR